jgi:hypothetical protein
MRNTTSNEIGYGDKDCPIAEDCERVAPLIEKLEIAWARDQASRNPSLALSTVMRRRLEVVLSHRELIETGQFDEDTYWKDVAQDYPVVIAVVRNLNGSTIPMAHQVAEEIRSRRPDMEEGIQHVLETVVRHAQIAELGGHALASQT